MGLGWCTYSLTIGCDKIRGAYTSLAASDTRIGHVYDNYMNYRNEISARRSSPVTEPITGAHIILNNMYNKNTTAMQTYAHIQMGRGGYPKLESEYTLRDNKKKKLINKKRNTAAAAAAASLTTWRYPARTYATRCAGERRPRRSLAYTRTNASCMPYTYTLLCYIIITS